MTFIERLEVHATILDEITRRREETSNNDLYRITESIILREHLDALERASMLPAPVIRRGPSFWRSQQ